MDSPSFPGGIWLPRDLPAPVIPPEAVEPVGTVAEPVAPEPERYGAINALKRRASRAPWEEPRTWGPK